MTSPSAESGRALPHSETLRESGRGSAAPGGRISPASRVLQPELLDTLPPSNPDAQHSRRDLRKLNWIMGHYRLMLRMMQGADFGTLIDLGSGDGQFASALSRKLNRPCKLVLVDQQRVPGAPPDLILSDVFSFLEQLERKPLTAIMANLFLHHFRDNSLQELFALIAGRADYFFACEPRRSRLSLAAIKLLPLIRCNPITRHDAAASIRAGFLGQELRALWPGPAGWSVTEHEGGFASHCFRATLTPGERENITHSPNKPGASDYIAADRNSPSPPGRGPG